MILTEDECFAALADDITEIEETRACEEEWTVIVAMCRAIEAAVIAKLLQGVSVEPVAWMANSGTGTTVTPDERMNKHYYNIPLYTESAIPAARVKALEDAALNCEELHCTWRMDDNSGPKECAEKIRALKGTL